MTSLKQQKKEAHTVSKNFTSYQFCCLLHISAFGATIIRKLKIHTKKDILSTIYCSDTFPIAEISTLQKLEM
jgi:hypothetical protein